MRKETLYICSEEQVTVRKDGVIGHKLFILPKSEVEKSIKSMEEDVDSELDYTVLGSIKPVHDKIPYLISYKIAPSNDLLYDVVYANEAIESHVILLGKARFKDKHIKIISTLDLTKLINEYYE